MTARATATAPARRPTRTRPTSTRSRNTHPGFTVTLQVSNSMGSQHEDRRRPGEPVMRTLRDRARARPGPRRVLAHHRDLPGPDDGHRRPGARDLHVQRRLAGRARDRPRGQRPSGHDVRSAPRSPRSSTPRRGSSRTSGNPTYSCVDIDGGARASTRSHGTLPAGATGDRHHHRAYGPVTPLMGLIGTWNMKSTSSVANAMKGNDTDATDRFAGPRQRRSDHRHLRPRPRGDDRHGRPRPRRRFDVRPATWPAERCGPRCHGRQPTSSSLTGDKTLATATARSVAADNGYAHDPAAGKTVDRGVRARTTSTSRVDISAPHRNNFTGVVGMTQWDGLARPRPVERRHPGHGERRAVHLQQGRLHRSGRRSRSPQYSDPNASLHLRRRERRRAQRSRTTSPGPATARAATSTRPRSARWSTARARSTTQLDPSVDFTRVHRPARTTVTTPPCSARSTAS